MILPHRIIVNEYAAEGRYTRQRYSTSFNNVGDDIIADSCMENKHELGRQSRSVFAAFKYPRASRCAHRGIRR